jgi:hypothetical protein
MNARTAKDLRRATVKRIEPHYVGELRLYCENSDCAARYINVVVKVYDNAIEPPYWCPICRAVLNEHAVLTFAEAEADDEWQARCSVNMQRYRREYLKQHPGAKLIAYPGDVLLDDSLP